MPAASSSSIQTAVDYLVETVDHHRVGHGCELLATLTRLSDLVILGCSARVPGEHIDVGPAGVQPLILPTGPTRQAASLYLPGQEILIGHYREGEDYLPDEREQTAGGPDSPAQPGVEGLVCLLPARSAEQGLRLPAEGRLAAGHAPRLGCTPLAIPTGGRGSPRHGPAQRDDARPTGLVESRLRGLASHPATP